MPEDITDPHVQGDDSKPTITDRLSRNKARLIGFSFAIIAVIAFLAYVVVVVAPGLLTNPLVQGALALTVFTALVFTAGGKRWLGHLKRHTLLFEMRPQGMKLWLSEFDRASRTAKHYRGITLFRGTLGHYLVEDFADKHQQHVERYGGDAEDPATVQYPPNVRVADTWLGTVAGVATRDYKPVGGRSDIHFLARGPKTGHEQDVEDLSKELDERDDLIGDLLDEIQDLEEDRDMWRSRYNENYETIREQVREDIALGHETARPRHRSDRGDRRRNESTDDLQPFMEDTEA
jgi:hypothetical protein